MSRVRVSRWKFSGQEKFLRLEQACIRKEEVSILSIHFNPRFFSCSSNGGVGPVLADTFLQNNE